MKRFQAVTTWGVLGLFTAVMVCGQGLHLLFGIHHAHCSVCSCGHSNHESPGADAQPALCAADHDPTQISEGDCPICSFVAYAQCLPVLPPTLLDSMTLVEMIVAAGCLIFGGKFLVYRSRDPPALAF